jgi:hypothetical protein
MSDRLALAHVIEDAGIPREKAEAVATAIARFIEGSAATKADVEAVKAELHGVEATLKAEIAGLRAELRTEITSVRAEIVNVRAEITRVADRTFNRLGTLVAVVAGILFAALHMWPPH